MKKRGMYSSRTFFKPCFTPVAPHSLNRSDDGQLRAYPYGKGPFQYARADWNHSPKTFHRDADSNFVTMSEGGTENVVSKDPIGGSSKLIQEDRSMKTRTVLLIGLVLTLFLLSGDFLFAQEDTQKHKSCPYCGMDRHQYAHSRVLISYDDGSEVGLCSLHCAAVELSLKLDKTPNSIQVGDYSTKKLIDAEKATWVIGGNKPGVMSKNAKWAFEKKEDADAYAAANGGTVTGFDQSIRAAYEDMYTDTKMIRDRRKMKRMQKEGGHGH
jgi:copper chaperone NosL